MNAVTEITPPRLPMPARIAEEGITESQWRVLCETIFPSAKTSEGICMAVSYCAVRNLDVFKSPVHIVPVWDSKKGKHVETVWVGLHEIRSTAHRTNNYAGSDPVQFGPEVTKKIGATEMTFPDYATFTVYRITQGQRCAYTQTVFFEETVSTGKGGNPTPMWQKRTKGQLAKCAEVAALRMAFPEEIGNDYIPEEMEGKPVQYAEPRAVIEAEVVEVEEKKPSKLDNAFGLKEEVETVIEEDPSVQTLLKDFPDAKLVDMKPTTEFLFEYMGTARDALLDKSITKQSLKEWEERLDFDLPYLRGVQIFGTDDDDSDVDYAPDAVRDLVKWLETARKSVTSLRPVTDLPEDDIPF